MQHHCIVVRDLDQTVQLLVGQIDWVYAGRADLAEELAPDGLVRHRFRKIASSGSRSPCGSQSSLCRRMASSTAGWRRWSFMPMLGAVGVHHLADLEVHRFFLLIGGFNVRRRTSISRAALSTLISKCSVWITSVMFGGMKATRFVPFRRRRLS